MNFKLLHTEIQNFIDVNIDKDISKLALQKNQFSDVNWIEILDQIQSKAKAKNKLPTWFNKNNILYPPKISIEQSSSEIAAEYKSTLVSGENLIDLTGGFGVDDYYFSKKIKNIIHCEINSELSDIVKHNFEILKVENSSCYIGDSLVILQNLNQKFDWIYIDPSRRSNSKGKVFMLEDCLPNVPENIDLYFNFSENILIKTAPILDIKSGLSELKNVKTIHIIAIENEVKELLWEIRKNHSGKTWIKTVNINKEEISKFEFILDEDTKKHLFSLPKKYLYEPNASIMKSGGFDKVSSTFQLEKLHQHSHLYTSNKLIDFPGRIFEIENCIDYKKNYIKEFFENKTANITIRNFPDTVENIRKKWKIKDGGNRYCFFTTDVNNNKIVLICNKIK